ncbi:3-dehydroquinate synthase [Neisseria sp. Ec49-e6-T10]|uniref:3-dehydroquinate synthase n=1 Tax=Neisseria sp. Ec49-e6-T10 TaxID=3140744 RepID=UPI003EBBF76C
MITLTVSTPDASYPIFIQAGSLNTLHYSLQPYLTHQLAIVTNETIAPLYLRAFEYALQSMGVSFFSIILPDGEQYKNWETLNLIYDALLRKKAERNTTLVALGGGVIGDMVGFAAATYQRGAPFIQVPTTLLSQVDSSVGGKTAINHPLGKNMIGAFYQPKAVLVDINTLNTLPDRELSAGLAEVIKYALIKDVQFLSWLEDNMDLLLARDQKALAYAIQTSCHMKAQVVAEDEKEHGVRALLNLGHTFGHAIETQMGYGVWLHGEAVAAGIMLACRLSEKLGFLANSDCVRVKTLLTKANLPVQAPSFAVSQWLEHMSHDKKVVQGNIRFVLLKSLGSGFVTSQVSISDLESVLSS